MPRLSVNINDETAAVLQEAKERRSRTATDTVRRAVSVYSFLSAAQKRGDRIQLVDERCPGGRIVTQVVIS